MTGLEKDHVDRIVARGLFHIAITAVAGVVLISVVGSLLRSGVFGNNGGGFLSSDEALSLLGQVASAAVGMLGGWWAHGLRDRFDQATETAENAGALKEAVDQAVEIVESGDG